MISNDISGVILAGGKSKRMGATKGLMHLNDKPFVSYSIEALKPLTSEIIIVSDDSAFDAFQNTRVDDHYKDAGPVAGLYSGLSYSSSFYNLVLSCDIPFINTEVLTLLVQSIEPNFEVFQFISEGKTHPLIAIYTKDCLSPLKDILDSGERRLRTAVDTFKVKTISLPIEQAPLVRNINTRQEYDSLLKD